MIEILRSLAHGVGNMTYGEPDATDAVSAADVVRWAVAEIELLRESLAIFVHAHATGNYVRSSHEAAARALLKEVPRD
jgi:hypothetical protein